MKEIPQRRVHSGGEIRKSSFAKLCICAVIILGALVVKYCFNNSDFHRVLTHVVHGGIDYEQAVSAIGRAIGGEQDVVSAFKSIIKPSAQAVSSDAEIYDQDQKVYDAEFYGFETQESKEARQKQEQEEIEKLSFQMSQSELYDDTKAEPFVIPPPSYCSYEKMNLNFKYTVPVYGTITSPYGYRDHPVGGDASFHTGMDIAAAKGTKVRAFASGTVLKAGNNNVYGNYILLEHQSGIRSFYGHNSKLCVKAGEKVKIGQKIAEVGSTGLSTGPHVHFEVRKGDMRLNPKHYISPENV